MINLLTTTLKTFSFLWQIMHLWLSLGLVDCSQSRISPARLCLFYTIQHPETIPLTHPCTHNQHRLDWLPYTTEFPFLLCCSYICSFFLPSTCAILFIMASLLGHDTKHLRLIIDFAHNLRELCSLTFSMFENTFMTSLAQ